MATKETIAEYKAQGVEGYMDWVLLLSDSLEDDSRDMELIYSIVDSGRRYAKHLRGL